MQLRIILIQQSGSGRLSSKIHYLIPGHDFPPGELSFRPIRQLLSIVVGHRQLARTSKCFLPLAACLILPGSVEARAQDGGFHTAFSLNHLSPVPQCTVSSEVGTYFQSPKTRAIAYLVCEDPWPTVTNHSKGGFLFLYYFHDICPSFFFCLVHPHPNWIPLLVFLFPI